MAGLIKITRFLFEFCNVNYSKTMEEIVDYFLLKNAEKPDSFMKQLVFSSLTQNNCMLLSFHWNDFRLSVVE